MRRIRLIAFIMLIALLSACTRPELSLFSTYSLRENLASYRVRTPDPSLNCPTLGQHIYVYWNLKQIYPLPLELKLYIRFGNRTEIVESIYLTSYCGNYVYSLINDDYFEKNGILTYKAELLDNGSIIQQWLHQLWVDRIVFSENGNEKSNLEESEEDNVNLTDEKDSEDKCNLEPSNNKIENEKAETPNKKKKRRKRKSKNINTTENKKEIINQEIINQDKKETDIQKENNQQQKENEKT